jgi:hypothetical protein
MALRLDYRAAALAGFVCTLLIGGCEATITEVVVVVETDLRVGVDINAIEVRVNVAGEAIPGLDASLMGADAHSLPLTLGLRSESDSDTPFSVEVRGLLRGAVSGTDREVISTRVSTRFISGERRVLRIRLTADCVGTTCTGSDLTCRDGMCRNVYVNPSLLPPLSSLDLGVDARVVDAGPSDFGPRDFGSRDLGPDDGGPDDAGPPDGGGLCAAGDSGVVGAPVGCNPARPGARPVCPDTDGGVGALHFALRDVIIDQSADRWRTLGWDMDGDCTDALSATPVAECTPPGLAAPSDGLDGRDNAFGAQIVPQFLAFQPNIATETAASLATGSNVPVVSLDGWNGLPDDPRVVVSLAYAIDLIPAGTPIPDGGVTDTNTLPDPLWDGTDVAYLSSSAFDTGGSALLIDDNAYVANGMIVARLPDRADIDLPGQRGTVRARLTECRFSAQIVGAGTALTNALVTGRWSQSDMLSYINDLGICPGTPFNDSILAVFLTVLTRSMDVRATPGTGGPGIECNAVSTAFPFENGVRVEWGEITPIVLPPVACP